MPRAFIKTLLSADLTSLFIVQEPKVLDPQAVDESLWLTFDILTGTHKFRSRTVTTFLGGGAGGIEVFQPVVPPDNYDYVFGAVAKHNDGAAGHRLAIVIKDLTSGLVFPIDSSEDRLISGTVFASSFGNTAFCLRRPFLLPPNFQMGASADAMGGAAVLSFAYAFVRHTMLDPHPKI